MVVSPDVRESVSERRKHKEDGQPRDYVRTVASRAEEKNSHKKASADRLTGERRMKKQKSRRLHCLFVLRRLR